MTEIIHEKYVGEKVWMILFILRIKTKVYYLKWRKTYLTLKYVKKKFLIQTNFREYL